MKNVIPIRNLKTLFLQTKVTPSKMFFKRLPLRILIGVYKLILYAIMLITKNPINANKKPGATPNLVPITIPPKAGPKTLVPCQTIEFNATALTISDFSIKRGKNACLVGP